MATNWPQRYEEMALKLSRVMHKPGYRAAMKSIANNIADDDLKTRVWGIMQNADNISRKGNLDLKKQHLDLKQQDAEHRAKIREQQLTLDKSVASAKNYYDTKEYEMKKSSAMPNLAIAGATSLMSVINANKEAKQKAEDRAWKKAMVKKYISPEQTDALIYPEGVM